MLRRVGSAPPGQLDRAPRGAFGFHRAKSPSGPEWRHQGDLQHKFLLVALPALRQAAERFDAAGQMGDGFEIRRTLERAFTGAMPITDSLFGNARLAAVVPEKFGLRRHGLREFSFRGRRAACRRRCG
jgi:hypothetical protein